MTKRQKPALDARPASGAADTPATRPAPAQTPPAPRLDALALQVAALGALQSVANDDNAPAAARAQAARTLLEFVGAIGRHAPEPAAKAATKPAAEMSLAELDAAIAALDRA